MLPGFENKLIALGTQIVLGLLQPQQAIEAAQKDAELLDLPDESLQQAIEETDRYWRERLEAAVYHPENIAIYPRLISACAEKRLSALSALSKGTSGEAKAALDVRRALWITILAKSFVSQALTLLLFPAEQKQAWLVFERAYMGACALPDVGQEVQRHLLKIQVCYGQRAAAMIAHQYPLMKKAEQELTQLVQIAGLQQEIQQTITEMDQDLQQIQSIHAQRQKAPPQQPQSLKDIEQDSTSYGLYYMGLLQYYAQSIQAGKIGIAEGKQQLLQAINFDVLEEQKIYFVSIFHRQAATNQPEFTSILAELNYAVASVLHSKNAELTRAYCAYALATALLKKADISDVKATGSHATYTAAISYFEEALSVLDCATDRNEVTENECASISALMVMCYTGMGDFVRAIEISQEAIRRMQVFPDRRNALGRIYGNLARAYEKNGQLMEAFDNYYTSLQIFQETQDAPSTRQGLLNFSNLCQEIGRIDDAMAAWKQAIPLLVEAADFEALLHAYHLMINSAFRTRRYKEALVILQTIEDLLAPHLASASVDKSYRVMQYHLLIWRGTIATMFIDALTDATEAEKVTFRNSEVEKGRQSLEQALELAHSISDEDLIAEALLQLAKFCTKADQLELAKDYCKRIDLLEAIPGWFTTAQQEVLGEISFCQKQYQEAIDLFKQVVATENAYVMERKIFSLFRLGEAYECINELDQAIRFYEEMITRYEKSRLNLYEESRQLIIDNALECYNRLIALYGSAQSQKYDPQKALFWLERSKSRTFVEAMGLSNIPLQDPPDQINAILEQERQLIQKLNDLRIGLFITSDKQIEPLDVQREMYTTLEELNTLWNQLAPYVPEYVDLRRGETIDWQELQTMLV